MEPIVFYPVDVTHHENRSLIIHEGDIQGATPIHHTLLAGGTLSIPANTGAFHIFTLIDGRVRFTSDGDSRVYEERVTYAPAPDKDLSVFAETDAQLLEIVWKTIAGDLKELAAYGTVFPFAQVYRTAKQYVDPNKSDKTISRKMVEQRIIPRFAMGSVESYGPDFVRAHDHPMLDQFFFSFPENDAFITIEGEPYRMRGNELLHIPLGSDHGVDMVQNKHCHYMWIDFMVDDTAMKRLDKSHQDTGTMRSFDGEA